MTKSVNIRSLAVESLMEIMENNQLSHQVIRGVLEKYQYLEKQERAFFTRLVEGTLERLLEMDYIINQFSKTKVKKMKPFIRNLLRISVYQLKYMDGTPDSAVCNEAVKLAEKKGFHGLKGFVNGVLRTIAREKEHIPYPKEEISAWEIKYSMPKWVIEELLETYSKEQVLAVLESSFRENATTIRCNLKKQTPEELVAILEKEGVTVKQHPYLSYALCISGYDYLGKLEAFCQGCFQVQDVSSMLVSEIGAGFYPKYVLDLCAAPGGKALHMAELVGDEAVVEARDVSDLKISLIEENIKRNGCTNVRTCVWDATEYHKDSEEKADVLIADLPCSGLGVMGKKKDICYKTTKEDVVSLAGLQREILRNAAGYVKPGGVLIYSTCTITKEENDDNFRWFLDNFNYEPVDFSSDLVEELQEKTIKEGYLQLLPGVHKSDGFFISVMRKKS